MKVLVVEDDLGVAEAIDVCLKKHRIQCEIIGKRSWITAAEEVCSRLRGIHNEDDVYDALLLDINFPDHWLGGVEIYCSIMKEDLRCRFRHIIIPTQYYSRTKHSDDSRAVEVFRQLTFIPPENVLPKGRNEDYENIVRRLKDLRSEKNTPIATYGMWEFR